MLVFDRNFELEIEARDALRDPFLRAAIRTRASSIA
jgi:hypothetical protein